MPTSVATTIEPIAVLNSVAKGQDEAPPDGRSVNRCSSGFKLWNGNQTFSGCAPWRGTERCYKETLELSSGVRDLGLDWNTTLNDVRDCGSGRGQGESVSTANSLTWGVLTIVEDRIPEGTAS
jgi:hypothetical protein